MNITDTFKCTQAFSIIFRPKKQTNLGKKFTISASFETFFGETPLTCTFNSIGTIDPKCNIILFLHVMNCLIHYYSHQDHIRVHVLHMQKSTNRLEKMNKKNLKLKKNHYSIFGLCHSFLCHSVNIYESVKNISYFSLNAIAVYFQYLQNFILLKF